MSNRNRSQLLGSYLLLCSGYQLALYFCPHLFPYSRTVSLSFNTSWFYFANPRVGLFELLGTRFLIAYWISATWLSVIAVGILAMPRAVLLKAYVALEWGLALLSIWYLFTAWLLRFGLVPEYSFVKDKELQAQCAVFIAFSVVPGVFAMSILRRLTQSRVATTGMPDLEQTDV
jgi:hypothetical protein